MARQTITVLTDDLDGGEADESVRFGLDGTGYEIDLSAKNADKLRRVFAPYVEKATRIGRGAVVPGRRGRGMASASSKDRELNRAIRQWAAQQGKQLAARGRIPQSIVDEYLSTH